MKIDYDVSNKTKEAYLWPYEEKGPEDFFAPLGIATEMVLNNDTSPMYWDKLTTYWLV